LPVGFGDTSSIGEYTGEVLVLRVTACELIRGVGSRRVVGATDTIEDVLAIPIILSTCGVASLEAEDASSDEAEKGAIIRNPLLWKNEWDEKTHLCHSTTWMKLLPPPPNAFEKTRPPTGLPRWKGGWFDKYLETETKEIMSHKICTVGVHLTTKVISFEVEVHLVEATSDLNIGWRREREEKL
jgi:hypothetical protein